MSPTKSKVMESAALAGAFFNGNQGQFPKVPVGVKQFTPTQKRIDPPKRIPYMVSIMASNIRRFMILPYIVKRGGAR